MNLKQIQTRISELSAELLTLSNDVAFILDGEISRQEQPLVVHVELTSHTQLRNGSVVEVRKRFQTLNNKNLAPGLHKIVRVEPENYKGYYSVLVQVDDEETDWVFFDAFKDVAVLVQY